MAGAWVLPVLLPSQALLPCLGSPGSWAMLPLWGRGGTRVTGVFQGCCLHKCCCWEEGSLELWAQLWLEGPASWVHHRCCPAPCGCGALCPTCHLCCCFQFYSSFGLSCCGCGGPRSQHCLCPWFCLLPLEYSCLKDPMDRGAGWAMVHGVTEWGTAEWLTLPPPCVPIHSPSDIKMCGSLQYPGGMSTGSFVEVWMFYWSKRNKGSSSQYHGDGVYLQSLACVCVGVWVFVLLFLDTPTIIVTIC